MKYQDPIAVALIPFVTFGIYSYIWIARRRTELIRTTKSSIPSMWFILWQIPTAVLVLTFMIMSKYSALSMVAYFALIIGSLATTLYFYINFGKAVAKVTNGKYNTIVVVLLFWLLGSIGMAVVQDSFNKLPKRKAA